MGCGCKKKKPKSIASSEKDRRIKEAMRNYMEFKKGNIKTKGSSKKSGK
tara:strand:- start:407 stop:553 length:147 start_codon:yes stop_codon:yes gene_type:complete